VRPRADAVETFCAERGLTVSRAELARIDQARNPNVSLVACLEVRVAVAERMLTTARECYASLDTLSADVGRSKSTVRYALRALEAAGILDPPEQTSRKCPTRRFTTGTKRLLYCPQPPPEPKNLNPTSGKPARANGQVFCFAKDLAPAPVLRDKIARKPRLVRSRGARPLWHPYPATSRAMERALRACRRQPRGARGVVRVAALAVAGLSAEDRGVLGRQASRLLAEGCSWELVAIGAVRCGAAGSPWSLRGTVRGPLAGWWREQEQHRRQVAARTRPTFARQRTFEEECMDIEAAEHWLPHLRERYGGEA
jgi:hypothetical protein